CCAITCRRTSRSNRTRKPTRPSSRRAAQSSFAPRPGAAPKIRTRKNQKVNGRFIPPDFYKTIDAFIGCLYSQPRHTTWKVNANQPPRRQDRQETDREKTAGGNECQHFETILAVLASEVLLS